MAKIEKSIKKLQISPVKKFLNIIDSNKYLLNINENDNFLERKKKLNKFFFEINEPKIFLLKKKSTKKNPQKILFKFPIP
jgi:hypothetical protein